MRDIGIIWRGAGGLAAACTRIGLCTTPNNATNVDLQAVGVAANATNVDLATNVRYEKNFYLKSAPRRYGFLGRRR